jgi:hypothetical protein
MITGLSILHEFKWKYDYKRSKPPKDGKLKRKDWWNKDCDRYFSFANSQEADIRILAAEP